MPRPVPVPRRLVPLLVALAALVLGACEVRVDVDVEVRDDGSGTVTVAVGLDEEAMARVPDLAEQLRTADLEAAGWIVDPPAPDDEGTTWVRAAKPFDDAAQATAILDEVTGADGPFGGLVVERSDGFAASSWTVSGTVDLADGVDAFVDPALADLLGGDADGGQLERIEAELGRPAAEMVDLRLTVDLPGAPAETVELPLAAGGAVPVSVESTTTRTGPRLLLGGGAALALLAALLAVGAVLRARHARAELASPDLPELGGGPGALALVVLDATGVVLEAADDVREVLVPYLWEAGCTADEATIAARHREAVLGALDPDRLWADLGLDGEPAVHEEYLLYRHRLQPGARELVERLVGRGVRVVVVANDVPRWAERLVGLTGLDGLVEDWITSARLGARFPERAAYEALAERLGVAPGRCLVIDDDRRALDAARSVGFATAWYQPNGNVPASPDHPTVRDLDRLDVAARDGAAAGAPVTPGS